MILKVPFGIEHVFCARLDCQSLYTWMDQNYSTSQSWIFLTGCQSICWSKTTGFHMIDSAEDVPVVLDTGTACFMIKSLPCLLHSYTSMLVNFHSLPDAETHGNLRLASCRDLTNCKGDQWITVKSLWLMVKSCFWVNFQWLLDQILLSHGEILLFC